MGSVTILSNEVKAVRVQGTGTSEADLVSVIILALEDDADIGTVLRSVEAQSHAVIDVIVVHQATARFTDQMLERYPNAHFVAEHGNSAMAARSLGLRLSKGEYIVFLSTEDRLLPRALDIALSSLRARPGCAMAFGKSRPFGDAKLAIAESQRTRIVRSDFFVELLRGDFIGKAGGAMYRRSALIDAQARAGSRVLINDYHLNLEIARENEICFHGALVAEHATPPLPTAYEALVSARGDLNALRAQRRYVRGHRHAEEAYREGLQAIGNKVFLVSSHHARRHAAARAWGTVATIAAKTLALEAACFAKHPRGLVRLFRTELCPWIARRFGTPQLAIPVRSSRLPIIAYSSKQTISQIIGNSIPRDAVVIALTQTSAELPKLDPRQAASLRILEARAEPADGQPGESYVTNLSSWREWGAEYVFIPGTSYWWADHIQGGLKWFLDITLPVIWRDDNCTLYSLSTVGTYAATKPKVLVAGYFSFEHGRATAGDLLVRDLVRGWLEESGFSYDVALAPPFVGGVDWRSAYPKLYSHIIFVCGPFQKVPGLIEFLDRFQSCRLFGVNLSMLEPLHCWNPFHVLLERDSSETVRPDLAFIAKSRMVPVVGLCLKEHSGDTHTANATIGRLVASREMVAVPVDTKLDEMVEGVNSTGLRSPNEVESLLARMDAVITTRLHGLVLSIKNGVPVVAIDPGDEKFKIETQARAIGWPKVFRISDLDDEKLQQALDWCLTDEARALASECAKRAQEEVSKVRQMFIDAMRAKDV